MMTGFLHWWRIGFFSLVVNYVNAQAANAIKIDSIKTTITYYARMENEGQLFVHFDKNIYSGDENAWLTAYFLKDLYSERQSFISIFLADDHNVIKIRQRLVMISGISSGKIFIPDSLKRGRYNFIVFYQGFAKQKPTNIFVQAVRIEKSATSYFSGSVKSPRKKKYEIISARFYPEGGNIVEGFSNNIGWEVKDEKGMPVQVTGTVYKNDQPIDTISTNRYGMGRFNLTPGINDYYYVTLPYSDARYQLPEILTNGAVINLSNAVANDTLSFFIKSRRPDSFHVIIHNYKQVFISFSLQVNAMERTVKIALTDLPKGIAEITLLNSLKQPCAERLFFAHYDPGYRLNISTNQGIYKKREKLSVNIELKNPDGKRVAGLVSIACVQAKRVSPGNFKEINSYTYLLDKLSKLPFKENYLDTGTEDRGFVEDILLIKSWRNYSWTGLDRLTPTDTLINKDSSILTGEVYHFNKPLKKAVSIIMMKDGSFSTIETNETGKFFLTAGDLLVKDSKKIRLYVSGPRPEEYKINITDPFQPVIDSLVHTIINDSTSSPDGDYPYTVNPVQVGEMISLSEVKINSRNDHETPKKQNACGDYVCQYGFLNCTLHPNDPGNKAPVKGETYKNYQGIDVDGKEIFTPILYTGCEIKKHEYTKTIDGISYPAGFYPTDYKKDSITEPQFLSTIYWGPIYRLSTDFSKPIEFYTSDLTGEYKIIVQGVTDNDVIYGERIIRVSE